MQRDAKVYLWDIANAAKSIRDFTCGKDLNAYQQDELLRSAVERKFGIVGEALSQLLRYFPLYRDKITLVWRHRSLSQSNRSRLRYHPERHGVGDCSGLSPPAAPGGRGVARGARPSGMIKRLIPIPYSLFPALIEHHRLIPIAQNPPVQVPADGA